MPASFDDSRADLGRYHRQTLLPGVGEAGQRRLLGSHALIVGCGALGCAAADLLCRAGVGMITTVDRDYVELTNLQRQTLFEEADAAEAMPKAEAARRRLTRVNSAVALRAVVDDFNHRTAPPLLATGAGAPAVGVIVDGTDNFETRYLLNDLAVARGVPYVYGGVVGTTGMQMTVLPASPQGAARPWAGRETPCLRCLFEEAPPAGTTPTCDTAGVLGPAVSIVAGFEAAEAIKVLLGAWDRVARSLLTLDLWSNELRRMDVSGARRADCPCCGRGEHPHLDGSAASEAATLCGRGSVQVAPSDDAASARIDLVRLAATLAPHGSFSATPYMLRGVLSAERSDTGEPIELAVFPNGRAIIKGTTKPDHARTLYARYIGG